MNAQLDQMQSLLDSFPGLVYAAATIDSDVDIEQVLTYLDWSICHAPHRTDYRQLLDTMPIDDVIEVRMRMKKMDDLERHEQLVFACEVVIDPPVDGATQGIVVFLASSVL